MQLRRKGLLGAAVVASAVTMVVATAPNLSFGADHADAPGTLQSPSNRPDADINDVYAFPGSSGQTVLAMTTHPAVGVLSPSAYATDVEYVINVDGERTNRANHSYALRFGSPGANGAQSVRVYEYTGSHAESVSDGKKIASGTTGQAFTGSGVQVFAGLRSDPFFFDLDAFKHAVLGQANGRTGFCDSGTVDFFKNFNTNAIVLSIPTSTLATKSPIIGVWGSTIVKDGNTLIDQMGRPAINTVFNHNNEKNDFNHTLPVNQYKAPFSTNIVGALQSLGGYDTGFATYVSHFLLPDILTYNTTQPVAGPLNGRKLSDDVIDAELGLVTAGGIPSDCVSAHTDYTASFPYLGTPHA
jgi:hypothetical protein